MRAEAASHATAREHIVRARPHRARRAPARTAAPSSSRIRSVREPNLDSADREEIASNDALRRARGETSTSNDDESTIASFVASAGARETIDLGARASLAAGWDALARRVRDARRDADRMPACKFDSGCLRFVIDVPRDARALRWVSEVSGKVRSGTPAFYWSPRAKTASGSAVGKGGSASKETAMETTRSDKLDFDAARGSRAGFGSCATWTDAGNEDETSFRRRIASMRRFLSEHKDARAGSRVYGAGRFDPGRAPEEEWASFGTHYFFLPTLEVVEGVKSATLTVSVAWDARGEENCGPSAKSLVQALDDACETLKRSMGVEKSSNKALPPGAAHVVDRALVPDQDGWSKDVSSVISRIRVSRASVSASVRDKEDAWIDLGSSFDESDSPDVRTALESLGRAAGVEAPSAVLDQFEAMTMAMDGGLYKDDSTMEGMVDALLLGGETVDPLRKVVLARRSKLNLNTPVDTFALVSRLQSRDPDAYQFVLRHPNGETFLGSTPERLFLCQGGRAVSEAVAGTRARGADDGEDAALAYDMLLSPKEHEEFAIVREEVRRALGDVADGGNDGVEVELEKGILRNVTVQHLYSRLSAPLASGKTEADLLDALHPTPAVCGYPRKAALDTLRAVESFDRGLYSGPLGWISADGAEFAVAIRSALVHPDGDEVSLYAGVGVVGSANAQSEWHELNLKTKPLESLLAPVTPLASLPNPNAAWATILIGELVRGGVTTFCIAPGSRSTPLALAAEKHVEANVVVCIDERSLGFYALGYAKGAAQPAAVICSSGTAVANLLPSVVEASESSTPLLLLTADRPYELRHTGANQTIDQVKIFGSYARFNADLAPPGDGAPARACATMAATALRYLRGTNPGPVHLNCAFREPLGPQRVDWDSAAALKGLEKWEESSTQFTIGNATAGTMHDGGAWQAALSQIANAKRGLLVVGSGSSAADSIAATAIAKTLGWAVAADATSGIRVGAGEDESVRKIPMIDYVLVEPSAHDALRPDVILQIGARLTSKRLCQFLEASAIENNAEWIVVEPTPNRVDPAHCVSVRVESSIGYALEVLESALSHESGYDTSDSKTSCIAFAERAVAVGAAVAREAAMALNDITANEGMSEMAVAIAISEGLPDSMGFFLGNSMPIRDVDAFSGIKEFSEGLNFDREDCATSAYGIPVTANRGASGIDGVISSAAGYAAGLGHPVTLIIGDVSFQHDSNGLLFLRERPGQPPVTVVVVNNGGGGIFNFLPVASQVDDKSFNRLFATPPDVSRRGLCEAHRVAYAHPTSVSEFGEALSAAWNENRHSVIEVTTSRARNLIQHKLVQRRCARAARQALELTTTSTSKTIQSIEVASFSLPLKKPTTANASSTTRDGWLLKVTLSDGVVGYGECSPLDGLHRESYEESGAQLSVVASLMNSMEVPTNVALLNGAFAAWIEDCVGVRSTSELFPTVRFALESAIANALAASEGKTLSRVMTGDEVMNSVSVNGLVDATTDVAAARREARALVDAGYTCLKVKVARGLGSDGARADAERLAQIRDEVGPSVALRADANRRWDLTEALDFGARAQELNVGLQYVEEPTRAAHEVAAFHFTTGIAVALDETIDDILCESSSLAEASAAISRVADQSTGIVAVVLKPSVIGGLEATSLIARIAMSRGVRPVISSAFESGIGLNVSAHLAATLDDVLAREIQAARDSLVTGDDTERPNTLDIKPLILALDAQPTSHGLGTASWFDGDVMFPEVVPVRKGSDGMSIHLLEDTDKTKRQTSVVSMFQDVSKRWGEDSTITVETSNGIYEVQCVERTPSGGNSSGETIVLLHGFMGSSEDWDIVARGLTVRNNARVIAIDLPAHGRTTCTPHRGKSMRDCLRVEAMRDVVAAAMTKLGCPNECTHVVAYSMGARIALTLDESSLKSIVSIGGSPGLCGEDARVARVAQDDDLAAALLKGDDAREFAKVWYRRGLFSTLVAHPRFGGVNGLAERRGSVIGTNAEALAACLAAASPGRQIEGWSTLCRLRGKLTMIVGDKDEKFKSISRKMQDAMSEGVVDAAPCKVFIVPRCGHAAHLEAPESVVARVLEAIDAHQ